MTPALATAGTDPLAFVLCPYCRRPVRIDVAVDDRPAGYVGPLSYAITLHVRTCPALR